MQQPEPDFSHRLNVSLRARVTLMVVMSPEEERVVSWIREVCDTWEPPRQCITWDCADGFAVIAGNRNFLTQSRDALAALEDIPKTDENAVIVLKDFHEFWNNPQVKRRVRNFSQKFRYNRRTIVIITPVRKMPDEIRDEAGDRPFPASRCCRARGSIWTCSLPRAGLRSSLSKAGKEKIIQAALGMTLNQARRSFSKAIVTKGTA